MKTIISSLLMLCCITAIFAKTIVWGTEATYPPFVSMNAQQKIVGLDADIAHAICQEMHASCQLVHAPWDSLIPSLNLGKFDAIWGGMDFTPERAKKINFSHPYFKNEVRFVTRTGSNLKTTPQGLAGKIVGTQRGNTFEYYLKENYGKAISIKTYASVQQAFMDLKMGRVDLVMSDVATLQAWLKKDNNQLHYALVGPSIHNEKYFGYGYAIGFAKKNLALRERVNHAIAQLRKQGKLQAIIARYTE